MYKVAKVGRWATAADNKTTSVLMFSTLAAAIRQANETLRTHHKYVAGECCKNIAVKVDVTETSVRIYLYDNTAFSLYGDAMMVEDRETVG